MASATALLARMHTHTHTHPLGFQVERHQSVHVSDRLDSSFGAKVVTEWMDPAAAPAGRSGRSGPEALNSNGGFVWP